MSIQFPANPQLNATFDYDDKTYIWDGEKWTASAIGSFDEAYVNISGDTMTGDLTVPSLNGGPLAGMRNQLINGDFRVRQFFNNGTGSNKYITDRWCTNDNTTGATPDVTDVNGASKGLRLDGGSRVIRQVVELPDDGLAGPFYNGSQWTMSIYSTVAPNQLDVRFVEGGRDIGTSVSITGVPAWTATTDVQGAYTRYTCTFTVNVNPDASSKGFRVSWSFASDATFTLAQLEFGSVATPFEHRPIGTELALCQRYFYTGGSIFATQAGLDAFSSSTAIASLVYPVTMRTTPILENVDYLNCSKKQAESITNDRIFFFCNPSSSSNNALVANYKLDAEL